MAEVFSGYVLGSHGFQKPVAIKRLLPQRAKDRVFVDRLIREAKLLVGMQHGNIVSVLDLARDGNDVFLVMEYVDGPTLGGFVCAAGVAYGAMWKLGQMVPGRDHIRFKELSIDEAADLARATEALIDEANLERV